MIREEAVCRAQTLGLASGPLASGNQVSGAMAHISEIDVCSRNEDIECALQCSSYEFHANTFESVSIGARR